MIAKASAQNAAKKHQVAASLRLLIAASNPDGASLGGGESSVSENFNSAGFLRTPAQSIRCSRVV
jgi:hypothetical protein